MGDGDFLNKEVHLCGGVHARVYSVRSDSATLTYQASLVHGILQARILEWIAISFSSGSFFQRIDTFELCY